MRRTIVLVACVSKKRPETLSARELYCSDWSIKARRYGYPPDLQEQATRTVQEQAKLVAKDWAE